MSWKLQTWLFPANLRAWTIRVTNIQTIFRERVELRDRFGEGHLFRSPPSKAEDFSISDVRNLIVAATDHLFVRPSLNKTRTRWQNTENGRELVSATKWLLDSLWFKSRRKISPITIVVVIGLRGRCIAGENNNWLVGLLGFWYTLEVFFHCCRVFSRVNGPGVRIDLWNCWRSYSIAATLNSWLSHCHVLNLILFKGDGLV